MAVAVAGLVLAGGRSRRMGGGDKALMPLAGRPLVGHVVDRLRPQVGTLALSANRDPADFAAFGLPVLPDAVPGFAGPLAGLLAGLRWAAAGGCSHLATAACDTPFLPLDLVAELAAAAGRSPGSVALSASGGRTHLAFGLWPVALAGPLARRLAAETDRSIRAFVAGLAAVTVAFPDAAGGRDPFFNINTPDDLAAAEAMVRMDRSSPHAGAASALHVAGRK